MDIFLIYLIKSAGVITLFLAFYYILLRKETFFAQNRAFLILGLLVSLIIPLITYTNIIVQNPIQSFPIITKVTTIASLSERSIEWFSILFYVYLCGVLVFFIRLCLQFFSLRKLISKGNLTKEQPYKYIKTEEHIAPFSFFNYIVYNPSNYSETELDAIVTHEKVHVAQQHSIDMLLIHLFTIFQWFNPCMWWYKKYIGQNLEFIADTNTLSAGRNKSDYQYLMLKDSIAENRFSIANPFFTSLIKKRIIMLNKSKSNKKNILKATLILPALGIFLLSFNSKDVYVYADDNSTTSELIDSENQVIELLINKNTTDKELKEIKNNLAKKNIDFSYTVVHNSKNEITQISIDFTVQRDAGKSSSSSSSSFNNGDDPIDPIYIVYNEKDNSIAMGNGKNQHIDIHEDSGHNIWMVSDHEDTDHKKIEIIKENGKETILLNGKEITKAEYEAMKDEDGVHENHVRIRKYIKGKENTIHLSMDDNHDIDKNIVVIKADESSKIFRVSGKDGEEPLILIDGKETTKEEMEKLDPSEIESIHVSKDKIAKKKFGKKGKHGVIEISTKKD